jgi:hypothetical protein
MTLSMLLLLLGTPALASGVPSVEAAATAAAPAKPDHSRVNPCERSEDKAGDSPAEAKNCAGITRMRLKAALDEAWDGADDGAKSAKVWLSEAVVRLSMPQKLFVSSSYPEDTCPYKATFEHERLHWDDNVKLYDETVKALKEDLAKAELPTKDKPAVLPRSRAVIDAFESQMGKKLHDLVDRRRKEFDARAKEAVAKRDTRKSYVDTVWSRCTADDWAR